MFGFTVYDNFEADDIARDGLMRLPSGSVQGGHAVCIIGFDDNQQGPGWTGGVCIANSWDTDWGCAGPNGQRGYFWMPWQLVTSSIAAVLITH